MDLQVRKQRREEMLDETRHNRLAKVLFVARRRRGTEGREVEG